MKFGLSFANTGPFTSRAGLTELAQGAEAAGFESVWTVEHVVFPTVYTSAYPYDPSGKMPMRADTPLPDPLLWLAFAASVTERLRLATGILILPQRNPLVLAKELATLDDLSGGRLELGIGVGWLEEEFDALGIPFAERGPRTDDAIEILRKAWSADDIAHASPFAEFSGVSINPKPARGMVPVHVGGHSVAAAKRAGRLGDGYFPSGLDLDLAELFDIVRQTAADCGRDPDAIELTALAPATLQNDPVAAVEEAAALGVDRLMVPAYWFWRDTRDALAAFGERVIRASATG